MKSLFCQIGTLFYCCLATTFAQVPPMDFRFFNADETRLNAKVNYIAEDAEGRLWIASDGAGLAVFDGYQFEYYQNQPTDTNSLPSNRILGLKQIHNGDMLIGTANGLSRFTAETGSLERMSITNEEFDFWSTFCESLIEDADGAIWIGSADGLIRHDPISGQTHIFRSKVFEVIPENRSENFNIRLLQDPLDPDIIWSGTQYGLRSFNMKTGQFTDHPHPPKWHDRSPGYPIFSIFDLEFSSDDMLWMTGWQSGGVMSYHTKTGKWNQYLFEGGNYADPYFKNDVFSVLPLNDSTVLFSARNGIGYVDLQSAALVYDDDFDVLQTGFIRETYLDQNGVLWLACEKGLARTIQSIVDVSIKIPQPVISSILANEEKVQPNNEGRFDFSSDVKELSMVTTAINPVDPESMEYRWKLVGYDRNWKTNENSRRAIYTNLSGGNYQFLYEARMPEGEWQSGTPIEIKIEKPFYLKPYFLALIGLAVVLILLGIVKLTAKITRREEEIKNSYERKLIEAELTTLRSQMNPHFIFNSLNSIYNYILNNETDNAAEYLVKFSKLMRMVLSQSKEKIVRLSDELDVVNLYLELEQIRFDQKFDYQIQIDHSLKTDDLYLPPMLIQPFIENSIWHGLMHKKEKGALHFSVMKKSDEEKLMITITDDGIGREKSRSINRAKKKKSFGLDITRKRLDSFEVMYGHKASLKIVDLVDAEGLAAGTEVQLEIPFIYEEKKI